MNGRKLNLISIDDGYSPPKTVEQTRRLVEQEGVAFIFGSLGDPTNLAVRQYLNDNKIPQLFVAALAESVADPEHYPWTIPLHNATSSEAHVYAKYILATKPNARIGVLYQNDPISKIFLRAIREGLGPERRVDDRQGGLLRTHRSDRRLAGHQPAGVGRRYVHHRRRAERRGASHPQGL